jgi:fructose-bisphosphate aldolase class II
MAQIEAIHKRLPETHLVMHGSSSVPQYLQDVINAHGGEMPQTWGVPVEEIERGIRHGVRKVNIDTDCRMAMSGAMRRFAQENPQAFDPRAFILAAMEELETLVRDRFERFGTAGNAGKIKPITLANMAKRYSEGVLDPHVAAA